MSTPSAVSSIANASAAAAMPLQDSATLAGLKKRTVLLLLILLPAIVLTIILVISERRPFRVADLAEKAIPATIVAPDRIWTSSRMTFSELQMQILETRDYVFRTYTDGSVSPGAGPVDLCVVFSEDNRKGTHPPDVCLEASGCHIVARSDRVVTIEGSTLAVREIITSSAGAQGDQYLYFAYFYKCGDTFTPSFYIQQLQIIWNGLTRQNTAGALIRYSTPMASLGDIAKARVRTDQLLTVTFPFLKKNLNVTR